MHHSQLAQLNPVLAECREPDVYHYVSRFVGEPWSDKKGLTCSEIIRRVYLDCFNIELPGVAGNIGLYPRHMLRDLRGRKGTVFNRCNASCWQQIRVPEHLSICVFDIPVMMKNGITQPVGVMANQRPHVALCLLKGRQLYLFHKDFTGARIELINRLHPEAYREACFYRHKELVLTLIGSAKSII